MDKVSISLVKLRLNQAKEDLEDSKYLYDKKSFKGANNRAYYSIFHTMKAILALEPTDFKKHKDVISYFNKNYINKEIFPKEFGHKIKKAEIIRDNSDYNDFYMIFNTKIFLNNIIIDWIRKITCGKAAKKMWLSYMFFIFGRELFPNNKMILLYLLMHCLE